MNWKMGKRIGMWVGMTVRWWEVGDEMGLEKEEGRWVKGEGRREGVW